MYVGTIVAIHSKWCMHEKSRDVSRISEVFHYCKDSDNIYSTSRCYGLLLCGVHAAAVEFMDSEQMRVVQKYLPLRCPLSPHPFYVLVETSGSHDQHDKEVSTLLPGRWAGMYTLNTSV